MPFSSGRYQFPLFHVPHIWDLTKAGAFRNEFIINPKYWGTVEIWINRLRYRLSENSIPFFKVIDPIRYLAAGGSFAFN
jgi:hypothetical protein